MRNAAEVLERIAQGMTQALAEAATDPRVPADLLADMKAMWERGFDYARKAGKRQLRGGQS